MTTGLYYEDFEVGQQFKSSEHRVDREEAIAFAREYDPQGQHIDEEAAKKSIFGKLVISGWQTSSRGYLTQAEHAYALALYAYSRDEFDPAWALHLRKDVRALLKTELSLLKSKTRVLSAASWEETQIESRDGVSDESEDLNSDSSGEEGCQAPPMTFE